VTGGNPRGRASVEGRMTRPKVSTLPAVFVLVALVGAACANATGGGGGSGSGGIDHPTGSGDLVLKVDTGGGFVAPTTHFREAPWFSLYGDGSLITQGPQIEIYPGPALPNFQVTRIDEEGIQAILQAAKDAGLLGPDRHYDFMTISDAPTTTFTVVADGQRHVISVYALDESTAGGSTQGIPPDELKAREALIAFRNKLGDLRSWLPQGSVGDDGPFSFDELRIFVLPASASPEPGLEQNPVDWPLSPDLATFGTALTSGLEARCGSVSGESLQTLLPLVEKSNELTPWESGGSSYSLAFRPLLPDENGCEGISA
jgi:hypothetical protein